MAEHRKQGDLVVLSLNLQHVLLDGGCDGFRPGQVADI